MFQHQLKGALIRLRPQPNDQTLLVKHLIFACQAKCLTVSPRPKTLLVQYFCCIKQKMFLNFFKNITPQILLNSACQAMFDRLTGRFKHFFCYCQATCNISALSNISQQQGVRACALAITLLFQNVGQQAIICDVAKRSNICCKANLKCFEQ